MPQGDATMAKSALKLNRSSDRLSKAVKVQAPAPSAPSMFTEGISAATERMYESGGLVSGCGTLPSVAYRQLEEKGVITADPKQVAALGVVDDLFNSLVGRDEPVRHTACPPVAPALQHVLARHTACPSRT